MNGQNEFRFDGPVYDPAIDKARLTGQVLRVFKAMRDGEWRTLGAIERLTGDPQASVSAQLRHLRKPRFGSHAVEKRRYFVNSGGWEYRLVVNQRTAHMMDGHVP